MCLRTREYIEKNKEEEDRIRDGLRFWRMDVGFVRCEYDGNKLMVRTMVGDTE